MKIPPVLPPRPPPAIRTLIIDDEPAARRGLRMLLESDPEVTIVGESGGGDEAAALLADQHADLVFLDVQMPGRDGFSLLENKEVALPAIIFVTAFDEYALKAFSVHAVDYLLKPYDDARFFAALRRGKDEVRRRQSDGVTERLTELLQYLGGERAVTGGAGAEATSGNRILLKSSGEIFFLKPEEIDYIEAEGDYMKFHVGGRTHLMRETMARLEARLDPQRFIRIHRSTIVNFDRLRKLTPSFGGDYTVILQDGTKLRLSRGYHERIAGLLKQAR